MFIKTHYCAFQCTGGPASSSGGIRRTDPPQPQAGSTARPGSGPSQRQLQQGRGPRHHGQLGEEDARHRLQPCGPLPGRASGECHPVIFSLRAPTRRRLASWALESASGLLPINGSANNKNMRQANYEPLHVNFMGAMNSSPFPARKVALRH